MTETKKTPFNTVSENLPFWPDQAAIEAGKTIDPFIGTCVGTTILGDDPDQTKNIPCYIFADVNTGEKFFIVQMYAIKKAVEVAQKEHANLNNIVFSFTFVGKTTANGKPFNQVNTGYCTIEEWDIFKAGEPTAKSKK